jgi:hypothetical protein
LTRKLNSPARKPATTAIATTMSSALRIGIFAAPSLDSGPIRSEAFLYRCVDVVW